MGKKVMIIDDDNDILFKISSILDSAGYNLEFLLDKNRIIPNVNITKPDVILLDMEMKEINGFAIAKELKQGYETRSIPIIGITETYIKDIRNSDFNKMLLKPLKPFDIISAIESV